MSYTLQGAYRTTRPAIADILRQHAIPDYLNQPFLTSSALQPHTSEEDSDFGLIRPQSRSQAGDRRNDSGAAAVFDMLESEGRRRIPQVSLATTYSGRVCHKSNSWT